MAGNVLWTSVFNQQGSQSQELTRQRIVQEERCGRRPATNLSGPDHDNIVRGKPSKQHSKLLLDPWQPNNERHSIQPPLVGYGGTIPRVRPEHTGVNNGEQAAQFVEHFGHGGTSVAMNAMKRSAPAGGSSALGTKPFEMPGTRGECCAALCTPHTSASTTRGFFLFSRRWSTRDADRPASLSSFSRSATWPRHLRLVHHRASGRPV